MRIQTALFVGIISLSLSVSAWADADGSKRDLLKKGPQLWAQNCARCHNYRSPRSYSDREWDIAVHHMRVRANLTAEESRAISEFLKSAN